MATEVRATSREVTGVVGGKADIDRTIRVPAVRGVAGTPPTVGRLMNVHIMSTDRPVIGSTTMKLRIGFVRIRRGNTGIGLKPRRQPTGAFPRGNLREGNRIRVRVKGGVSGMAVRRVQLPGTLSGILSDNMCSQSRFPVRPMETNRAFRPQQLSRLFSRFRQALRGVLQVWLPRPEVGRLLPSWSRGFLSKDRQSSEPGKGPFWPSVWDSNGAANCASGSIRSAVEISEV